MFCCSSFEKKSAGFKFDFKIHDKNNRLDTHSVNTRTEQKSKKKNPIIIQITRDLNRLGFKLNRRRFGGY